MSAPGLPVDPGLLARMREAYGKIAWSEAPDPVATRGRTARLARLHDESARVETSEARDGAAVEVTSGPVGALVLLVEIERRGPARQLGARDAGASAGFPEGSILASWGDGALRADRRPVLRDLVELARYALP